MAEAPTQFTRKQRILLWLVTKLGWLAIRLIGPTMRFSVTREQGAPAPEEDNGVWVFWHRCVFPSTWYFRDHSIAVMTSASFDGEYIARIIEAFGFRAVRGSSTRGGVRALLGMHTEIEAGRRVAFTIDGPKGPIYVAKPGPVLLARNTNVPIVAFYVAVERAWVMNSWDRFIIPKPFSRAHIYIATPISIPPDTDATRMNDYHVQMQAALERATREAERVFGREPSQ